MPPSAPSSLNQSATNHHQSITCVLFITLHSYSCMCKLIAYFPARFVQGLKILTLPYIALETGCLNCMAWNTLYCVQCTIHFYNAMHHCTAHVYNSNNYSAHCICSQFRRTCNCTPYGIMYTSPCSDQSSILLWYLCGLSALLCPRHFFHPEYYREHQYVSMRFEFIRNSERDKQFFIVPMDCHKAVCYSMITKSQSIMESIFEECASMITAWHDRKPVHVHCWLTD